MAGQQPTRGIIQGVELELTAYGSGPMATLTVLTASGSVERVPCSTAGLPPSGREIVYWRTAHAALGDDAPLLGWVEAAAYDQRHPEAKSVRDVELEHADPLRCGECNGVNIEERGGREQGHDFPRRLFCLDCNGWAD